MLEAFAHRRPVVATTIGTRGIPVQHGEHLLVADDASSFAAACQQLLDDAERGERLADAAFQLVHERFTTDQISASLADVLSRSGR